MTLAPFILASASPRRRDLLAQVGWRPEVIPADVDESPRAGEDPVAYVLRVAEAKARAVAQGRSQRVVLAADTTVDLDGEIIGKPVDDHDARRILALLSGRTHRVHTGVVICHGSSLSTTVVTTLVTFVPVDPMTIEWYLGTGEPRDVAGAYAVQGAGGMLVERIQGSVSNVVGLPLAQTVNLLGVAGVQLPPVR